MIDDAGVPAQQLEWHGHNDFHKVLVNPTTAWLYGCAAANGALLGFGERTGNTPLEGLVIEYIQLRGDANGVDTTVITEIRNYFEQEIGVHDPAELPVRRPQLQRHQRRHPRRRADQERGDLQHLRHPRILNRPVGVTITDKSGLAGIAHWVNSRLRSPAASGSTSATPASRRCTSG